ncbi:small-conductance calcium-activated potassium channel protein [Stylonychia lemnae]|uniref:Small-conductance calcium-activated potassium channel protein n=1 Tax=Stylonychia lemnae TaxID=5949 RepID=A0A078AKX0_STYLE|nr:small-conductance calcium-activated potassium channel protein [Stylonychia lemnae]|eukprot:CDW81468.1 small-conductance calcium-activated potassium channel protein [Stylonychia lemnae]
MDDSSFVDDTLRGSLNQSQQSLIRAATKKTFGLKKKDSKVAQSIASFKKVKTEDQDDIHDASSNDFTPIDQMQQNDELEDNRILSGDARQIGADYIEAKTVKGHNDKEQFGNLEKLGVKDEYLKCRKRLKVIDTLGAIIAIINGLLSYIEVMSFQSITLKQNEYFRNEIVENGIIIKESYKSGQTETNLRFIIIIFVIVLDILIFMHYKLKFEKLKIELKRKRSENLYNSDLCLFMVIELIICSFFTPPYLDYAFSGKMLGGKYIYSLNDLIVVASLMKSYNLVRLYYHYSRWTTPDAEELCKSQNILYRTFISSDGKTFAFEYIYNSMWLVIITMTTVGYGDIYPQTHFGRFFGVISCLIGMLLVSYLVVGMNSLFDFTPQEQRAYGKLKKLTATDYAMQKAANVIKTAFKISKNRKKRLHKKFIYFLLLKKHISLFKNENKIAHSRLLPTDQMIKNLEEKLRTDLHELRDNIFELANFEERCEQIRIDQDNQYNYFTKLLSTQEQIAQILLEYNNTIYNEQANKMQR